MKCHVAQKKLALYLEKALSAGETRKLRDHIEICPVCQRELVSYQASWEMLDQIEKIQPSSDYVSRFWTNVATQRPWYQVIWQELKSRMAWPKLVPVMVTVCVLMGVSWFSLRYYRQFWNDWQMLEDMELVENLDLIEHLDVWENWEIIADLDNGNV